MASLVGTLQNAGLLFVTLITLSKRSNKNNRNKLTSEFAACYGFFTDGTITQFLIWIDAKNEEVQANF